MRASAFLILVLLAAGCGDDARECPCPALMPLAVGNRWDYVVCFTGGTDGIPSCDGSTFIQITEVGKVEGEDYFLTNGSLALRQMPEGLSFGTREGDEFGQLEILFRYPVADGSEYRYISSKARERNILDVRVKRGPVSTPLRTYTAYTYDIYDAGVLLLSFSFAPGVGLVKSQNYWGVTDLLTSVSLVESAAMSRDRPAWGICGP